MKASTKPGRSSSPRKWSLIGSKISFGGMEKASRCVFSDTLSSQTMGKSVSRIAASEIKYASARSS